MKGFCHCGCGGLAPLATKTDRSTNRIKGQPMRFISGHNGRVRPAYDGPLYEVDESTGCWVWMRGKGGNGYGTMYVEGVPWRAHRWFYFQAHGEVPGMLDHICRNRACVNPDHLRPANEALNGQNRGPVAGRFRGVTRDQRGGWRAQCGLNGRNHFLGRFDTEEEAAAAASAFRAKHMPYSDDAAKAA